MNRLVILVVPVNRSLVPCVTERVASREIAALGGKSRSWASVPDEMAVRAIKQMGLVSMFMAIIWTPPVCKDELVCWDR